MPGVGSIAECSCGYKTHVRHGATMDGQHLVVTYLPDKSELSSMLKTEAEAKDLEYILDWPMGPDYRCPRCKQNSLSFKNSGLRWD